jgi:disulfide bond formation protein DsbB
VTTSQPKTALLLGIGVLCLAAVAAALVTQHVFDMQPCP